MENKKYFKIGRGGYIITHCTYEQLGKIYMSLFEKESSKAKVSWVGDIWEIEQEEYKNLALTFKEEYLNDLDNYPQDKQTLKVVELIKELRVAKVEYEKRKRLAIETLETNNRIEAKKLFEQSIQLFIERN